MNRFSYFSSILLSLFLFLYCSPIHGQSIVPTTYYSAGGCDDKQTEICFSVSDGSELVYLWVYIPPSFQVTDPGDFTESDFFSGYFISQLFWPPSDASSTLCIEGDFATSSISTTFSYFLTTPTGQILLSSGFTKAIPALINGTSSPVYLSDLYGPGGPLLPPSQALSTPQTIKVSGTLIIDEDYSFVTTSAGNSEIIMNEDAKIIVQSGSQLNLSGNSYFGAYSQVYGCGGQLWNSIEVEEGAKIRFMTAKIEDGEKAINILENNDSSNPTDIFVRNNYLLNNQIGINIENNSFDAKNNITTDLLGNRFEISSSSYVTNNTAGIKANDTDNLIINSGFFGPAAFYSSFTNLKQGIFIDNSQLSVFDVQFTRMAWYGINARNFSSVFLNNSSNNYEEFSIEGGSYGIFANNSDIDIRKAIINSSYGIRSIGTFNGMLSVTDSEINGKRYGILASNGNFSSGDINNNTITKSSFFQGDAIKLAAINGIGNNFTIADNSLISVEKGFGNCISLLNTTNIVTKQNPNINQQTNSADAIKITGGSLNQFDCNNVNGGSKSIYLSGSTDARIGCNSLEDAKIGLQVFNSCNDSKIRGNSFLSKDTDLVYGLNSNTNYAVSGRQPETNFEEHHGNCFEGDANSGFEAINYSTDVDIVGLSRYLVAESFMSNCDNMAPDNAQSIPGWMVPSSSNFGVFSCPSNCNIPLSPAPSPAPDFDIAVRDGTLNAGAYTDAVLWTASQHLYKKLKEQPLTDPQFSTFMDQNETTNIGKFYDIEQTLTDAFQFSSSDLNTLLSSQNEKRIWMDSINDLYYSWGASGIPMEDWPTEDLEPILESVSEIDNTIQDIYKARKQGVTNILSELTAANADISTSTTHENNEKKVNQIYLSYLASSSDEFNVAQTNMLEMIANQCPLSGGDAVYKARGYLALTDSVYTFDDEVLCSFQGNSFSQFNDDHNIDVSNIKAYPVPASDHVNIVSPEFIESGIITLYNTKGQLVKEVMMRGRSTINININHLPSGIYYGTLRSEKARDQYFKVNIVR